MKIDIREGEMTDAELCFELERIIKAIKQGYWAGEVGGWNGTYRGWWEK